MYEWRLYWLMKMRYNRANKGYDFGMDDGNKQVGDGEAGMRGVEGDLGAAGAAKMSAHEGVNLTPRAEMAAGVKPISEVSAAQAGAAPMMSEMGAVGVVPMAPGVEESIGAENDGEMVPGEPSRTNEEMRMTPDELIAALSDMPEKGIGMSRREHKWVRYLRGLIWLVLAVTLPIGAALMVRAETSECLANGTAAGMARWGKTIFYVSLGAAVANLIWGIVRWFGRWNRERWGILRVIWKLIYGLIVRVLVFTPVVLVAMILVTPVLYNHLADGMMRERAEAEYPGVVADAQGLFYGEAVPCRDFCEENFDLELGEAKYYYALAKEFAGVNVEFTGEPETLIKVFGRQGEDWREVAKFYETMNYTVATDAGYEAFAFAIENTAEERAVVRNAVDEDNAEESVTEEDATGEDAEEDVTEGTDEGMAETVQVRMTVLAESLLKDVLEGEESLIGDSCVQVDFDRLVDFPVKMTRMLRELMTGEEVETVFEDLSKETGTSKLVRHVATACTRALKTNIDYNKLQLDLEKAIGKNWRMLDKFDEKSHISVYMAYRPLLGEMTGYFLVRVEDGTEVVRVRLEERTPAENFSGKR